MTPCAQHTPNNGETVPVVLTIGQAAELAGVPPHELAELVDAGAVPSVTIGATTVIPRLAFTTWLDDQALTCWRIRGELAAAGVWLGDPR